MLGAVVFASPARALNPQISKLYSRGGNTAAAEQFGDQVCITDRWILVGVPGYDLTVGGAAADDAGAVLVFDVKTGRYLRRLTANDSETDVAGDAFGSSVAVCGNRAVIGAPQFGGGQGAAYVFDLLTGKKLYRLLATGSPGASDQFGTSVATDGDNIAVGAPGTVTNKGSVFVFLANSGLPKPNFLLGITPPTAAAGDKLGTTMALCGRWLLAGAPAAAGNQGKVFVIDVESTNAAGTFTLTASDGLAGDWFGWSLAVDGPYALVGAIRPGNPGAAYLIHLPTAQEVTKFTASDGAPSDLFGSGVALNGNLALIGASGKNSDLGGAYLYDITSGAEMRRFTAPDGRLLQSFGGSVALCGPNAVIGAPEDGDLGSTAGAVYYYRPLAGPLPFRTIAKSRDFAPGVVDADFGTLLTPAVNSIGEMTMAGTLTGAGSNRNRDRGIWTDTNGPLSLITKSRNDLTGLNYMNGGEKVGSVSMPVFEQDGFKVFPATLTGTGVTKSNNAVVLGHDGTALETLARTGDATVNGLDSALALRFPEVLQTRSPSTSWVVLPYVLNAKAAGATATTDTGVLVLNQDGSLQDKAAREGQAMTGLLG
ncbi:MAG: FG-GAP repeat protein, partial [Planctomycetales bacterium]|nr:FG-GAP repeat protein [Planctomycetales bacterium]